MSKKDALQSLFSSVTSVDGSMKKVSPDGTEEIPFSKAQFKLVDDEFHLLGEVIPFSEDNIIEIDGGKAKFEFQKKGYKVAIEIAI